MHFELVAGEARRHIVDSSPTNVVLPFADDMTVPVRIQPSRVELPSVGGQARREHARHGAEVIVTGVQRRLSVTCAAVLTRARVGEFRMAAPEVGVSRAAVAHEYRAQASTCWRTKLKPCAP
jgi:hypothetical protein